MGFDDPCFGDSEDDMIRAALDSGHEFLRGITLERLEREHFVRLTIPEPFLPFAGGKCEFGAETLDYTPPVESRLGAAACRYPLELISPKNDDSMNSTFGNRPEVDAQTAVLSMNASDANARGIAGGDPVRVYNDRGSCTLMARIDDSVAPGVVCARAVRWNKRAPDARNVNALTSDRLTDAGGGPTFYSCLVEVETCGD